MVSRLDNIIRFHSRKLDDERRKLVALEQDLALILAQIDALKAEELAEKNLTGLEVAATEMAAYLKGVSIRRAALRSQQAEKEGLVDDQSELVRGAFKEMKTLEIAREKEQREILKKRRQQEQRELDEQALRPFNYPKP